MKILLVILFPFFLCESSFSRAQQLLGTFEKAHFNNEQIPCKRDGKFETGDRLFCGTKQRFIEILHTKKDPEGAAVLTLRKKKNLEPEKTFFRCKITEKNDLLHEFSCKEVETLLTNDEDELVSPIKKSHPILTIPNSHEVGLGTVRKVYRGMAPKDETHFDSLKKINVTDILIFKNAVGKEVERERENLKRVGFDKKNIHFIPFLWKDHPNYENPCRQTVQALKIIKNSKSTFFHCTVGEDRTGFLAGVYRLLTENKNPLTIFHEELCEKGYEAGDARKPYLNVTLPIRKATTLLYLKLAHHIKEKKLTLDTIDESVCLDEPFLQVNLKKYLCKSSTRFRP